MHARPSVALSPAEGMACQKIQNLYQNFLFLLKGCTASAEPCIKHKGQIHSGVHLKEVSSGKRGEVSEG